MSKNVPKIGQKVSLWVEGQVKEVKIDVLGTRVEVYNKKTGDHCFIGLNAIEPFKNEVFDGSAD